VEALLKMRKLPFKYEVDTLEYSLSLAYKPDWTMGAGLYLEAKGRFDYIERRKIAAVKEAHPDKEVRMCFMRNQKISKSSKTTYGDWCDKHGIKWSVYPELPL
jgi:hypothetical protein